MAAQPTAATEPADSPMSDTALSLAKQLSEIIVRLRLEFGWTELDVEYDVKCALQAARSMKIPAQNITKRCGLTPSVAMSVFGSFPAHSTVEVEFRGPEKALVVKSRDGAGEALLMPAVLR